MKRIFLLLLAATSGLSAQITKNVGDFNRLSVFDRISVELIQSNDNRVEITGKRSGDVEVINKNGELKLRMKLDKLLKGETIEAKVYYTNLKSINAAQGSYVSSNAPIKTRELDLNSKEGSEIKLSVNVDEIDTRSVTGGIITLSGTARELDADLGTGGILNAKGLHADEADVDINAGGEASVYATRSVDAEVRAGGDIVIYGNPAKVEEKTTLGGSIRRAN